MYDYDAHSVKLIKDHRGTRFVKEYWLNFEPHSKNEVIEVSLPAAEDEQDEFARLDDELTAIIRKNMEKVWVINIDYSLNPYGLLDADEVERRRRTINDLIRWVYEHPTARHGRYFTQTDFFSRYEDYKLDDDDDVDLDNYDYYIYVEILHKGE